MFISPELYEDAVRELDVFDATSDATPQTPQSPAVGVAATNPIAAAATTRSLRSSTQSRSPPRDINSVAATLPLNRPEANSPQLYRSAACGDPDASVTQSHGMTVPSSPSTSTLRPTASTQSLRPRFLFSDPLQSQSESLATLAIAAQQQQQQQQHSGGGGGGVLLERSGSNSHMSPKMRSLAQAASNVIQHVVQVGSCGDPRCLMFFDPEVFTAPLTLASRQRMASFRRYPSASGLGRKSSSSGGSKHQSQTTNSHPSSDADKIPTATVTSDEEEDLDDEAFDPQKVGRRLFSSAAQQSVPLHEYVSQALCALSASQSPIRCSPETFVFALVLLERVQHTSLLSSSTPAVAPQHTMGLVEPLMQLLSPTTPSPGVTCGAPGLVAAGPPACAATAASVQQSTPMTNANPSSMVFPTATAITSGIPEDRIRSFLDETPAVQRLTSENLHALHANSRGPSRSATPALTVGQRTSDTESLGLDRGDDRTSLGGATGGGEARQPAAAAPSLCADCLEHPGLALHASNVHLFFAAAVLVALKVREDVFAGSPILTIVASVMSCPSARSLLLAERCLCHLLDFNVNVTPSEYRQMLRQLHANRNGNLNGAWGGGGRQSPSSTAPYTDGAGEGGSVAANFMSLFAQA